MAERKDYPICFDGLFRQNIVLTSGLVTAPVIVAATTAERAAILSLSFFMISYFSILICRMIPKKISYTICNGSRYGVYSNSHTCKYAVSRNCAHCIAVY